MSTYTQHYSNFIGVDLSSDARSVARNRLAYAVNMWRDYESEQGEAVETFPGFRRLVRGLGVVHGLFAYRAKSGDEYLVVHAGTRLYCFESESVAAKDDEKLTEDAALDKVELEDGDSQGFIFNNNLYILDGKHFVVVSSVTDKDGATSVTASDVNAYVPTTYYDGKPYEQRNMLIDEAYEVHTKAETVDAHELYYTFNDYPSDDRYRLGRRDVTGLSDIYETSELNLIINKSNYNINILPGVFYLEQEIKTVDIIGTGNIAIREYAFGECDNLETLRICLLENTLENGSTITIEDSAFMSCEKLSKIELYCKFDTLHQNIGSYALPEGVSIDYFDYKTFTPTEMDGYDRAMDIHELATDIINVTTGSDDHEIPYETLIEEDEFDGEEIPRVKSLRVKSKDISGNIKIHLELHPLRFTTIENVKSFHDGNPDYEGTGVEAINGCTKSAVFDGRIFLTGNPALPNTVFYSNRNLTGANDPTYWGAYNYFNDGDGNTPNVDLLSTPSMLMVLKNNTVQDGSVYYHVPAYNEDEYSRDLVPKIYPSTAGAAGIGSAGNTVPGTTACNFLDDPVFLSTRGLEAVGKQTVNLERTLTHRSSNVDRLFVKEDLSKASLAEWKGYLVICCDGRLYLADSRQMHQHPDGSYQYEWYYLEGLGCYEDYYGGYRYLDSWYAIDEEGHSLAECTLIGGRKLGDVYALSDAGKYEGGAKDILVLTAFKPDGSEFYFYTADGYALDPVDEERVGSGVFYPATKTLVIGERLFFGTAGGDVCVINTDKRGVSDDFDGDIGTDRISTRWYTFHGVSYPSICVTRLDDCSKKSLAKSTVPGTAVARFKMMPGSRVRANVSLNGRDFKKVGEAFVSRYDAADIRFDNFSFTENEDAVVVLRELTRNWVDKQYSFVSDGFREPFGLYELSYLYNVKGKIRI